MSTPTKRIALLSDRRGREPRRRCSCSALWMRGRAARLEIPFEPGAPGEGANLRPEDIASRLLRRPSPGSRLCPSSPLTTGDGGIIQGSLVAASPRIRIAPAQPALEPAYRHTLRV